MRKRISIASIIVIFAAVLAAATAGSALASGGVSIEQGNSWDVFQPNPANPGDTVNVTVTTLQT
ncbi:MAG: hypothetical protein ACRDHE_11230, partial [Ktedonobacterales bacterium]